MDSDARHSGAGKGSRGSTGELLILGIEPGNFWPGVEHHVVQQQHGAVLQPSVFFFLRECSKFSRKFTVLLCRF